MLIWRPYFFDLIVGTICMALLIVLFRWVRDLDARYRSLARSAIVVSAFVIAWTVLLAPHRVAVHFPHDLITAVRVLGITTALLVIYSAVMTFSLRRFPGFSLRRRNALKMAGAAVVAAPIVVASAAFIKRNDLRFVEVDIPVPDLPRDLHGLRIVQLTDIHLSLLVSESLLARAIDMANEARATIAVITGDLVTWRGDPLDVCLRQLARLRSDAGTFGCLGNHEMYAGAETYTAATGKRLGMRFLRSEAHPLRFGGATLNIAGVDYQRRAAGYLRGAERLVLPGATNLLLSHNPDVFNIAARQGFDVTLAGHTHGGQVTFEIVHPALNVARFYTPFVHGLYEDGPQRLFVSRGIGTIGVPARLGAPPEVAVLRLCAT